MMLSAGVTADITDKVKAGELVNLVAQQVGGKGGGRADMAQAGGYTSTISGHCACICMGKRKTISKVKSEQGTAILPRFLRLRLKTTALIK
jgi:hypothetical protein